MKSGVSKDKNNVILVFENASDAHWMKDVVQFPNALSKNMYDKCAQLLARPNHRQQELAKHIHLVYLDERNEKNIGYLDRQDFSKIITDPRWYLSACIKSAKLGSVLILYPFYGNPYKGAKYFKFRRWARLKKAHVIIKSDGTLHNKSTITPTLKERIIDFAKYFFIDKIVCENKSVFDQLNLNQPHLHSKLIYVPNCPLDLYNFQKNIPFAQRPDHFLFVGRADDLEKGFDVLLKIWLSIFKEVPNWKLLLAGPCSPGVKETWEKIFAKQNGLQTIKWLGPVNPKELLSHYNNAKIVVCPSRKESGPIVLSEAILSGCAFIGTDVGEIPPVLEGLPGLAKNDEDLQNTIIKFAGNNSVAEAQAVELYKRLKNRNWIEQTKHLASVLNR